MTASARPERPSRSRRALLAFSIVLGVGGVGLAAFALSDREREGVTFDATPATAATTPVTVAPLVVPATTTPPATEASTGATASNAATTLPISPLADLLGPAGTAIPPAIEPRVRPLSVTIDDLELWGPVRAVGLEQDGQLEVPDETEIGWYRYGSSPGRPGATVLAAHVTWNQTVGPFFRLRELEPGARVEVRLEDDTTRTYEVVERAIYDKDDLPRGRIWRTTGDESLVLITCGGSFNPDISRYRQNVVVYAVPVA